MDKMAFIPRENAYDNNIERRTSSRSYQRNPFADDDSIGESPDQLKKDVPQSIETVYHNKMQSSTDSTFRSQKIFEKQAPSYFEMPMSVPVSTHKFVDSFDTLKTTPHVFSTFDASTLRLNRRNTYVSSVFPVGTMGCRDETREKNTAFFAKENVPFNVLPAKMLSQTRESSTAFSVQGDVQCNAFPMAYRDQIRESNAVLTSQEDMQRNVFPTCRDETQENNSVTKVEEQAFSTSNRNETQKEVLPVRTTNSIDETWPSNTALSVQEDVQSNSIKDDSTEEASQGTRRQMIRRKDGNPLLGLGYDDSARASKGTGNKVPPGGFSHGIW